ncbi:hypothetical protein [Gemmatimonas sp.]|uniref:hypothetical protein n=1 Tax=Gemmatimonas sp. TaxID=1962908 RepID=UPI0025C3A12E|nr:hypothetical protein [Gemmatimonas sp.]MCA2991950.1 hypothetical protein [Gemmatimonas sp.]
MAILNLVPGKENAIGGTIGDMELLESQFKAPDGSKKFQYKFTLATGDAVYLDKDAVERQTARMNKLPNDLIGETVTFWKKPMPNDPTGKKGYLNIDLGNTAPRVAQMAQAALTEDNVTRDLRTHGAIPPKKDYDQIKAEYVACLADAVAIIRDTNEAFDESLGGDAIMSAAATLYIQRTKAGV